MRLRIFPAVGSPKLHTVKTISVPIDNFHTVVVRSDVGKLVEVLLQNKF